jgi:hypothetical protein
MESLNNLLELARAGHFETRPRKPQERPLVAANDETHTETLPPGADALDRVLTRHWRIDFLNGTPPFRVTFVEPWTRPGLLADALHKRPDLPAPDLRPLPPDFETETLQQLNLT